MKLVCIAGGTCSGKTTLALRLAEALGGRCALMPLDNYYRAHDLPFAERAAINHDLPEAFDWPLLREHLRALLTGESVEMPVYDFASHNRTERSVRLDPTDILLLEGLYALRDEEVLAAAFMKVFLDSTREQRRERRLSRDLAERGSNPAYAARKFDGLAEPAHRRYVEPGRARADFVASNVEEGFHYLISALAD